MAPFLHLKYIWQKLRARGSKHYNLSRTNFSAFNNTCPRLRIGINNKTKRSAQKTRSEVRSKKKKGEEKHAEKFALGVNLAI